jgi:hypothetical protein
MGNQFSLSQKQEFWALHAPIKVSNKKHKWVSYPWSLPPPNELKVPTLSTWLGLDQSYFGFCRLLG